ncbi:hypothetical protein ECTOBSL9_1009 [Ectothiorhodospira sp. BSL-9]|nr:hypothetical protein ECTOBSL9_1009 [Ectothiorhodospira sp. BSL-9]
MTLAQDLVEWSIVSPSRTSSGMVPMASGEYSLDPADQATCARREEPGGVERVHRSPMDLRARGIGMDGSRDLTDPEPGLHGQHQFMDQLTGLAMTSPLTPPPIRIRSCD